MNEVEVNQWRFLAGLDEDTARLIREHSGHPEIGIYHLHQAAEKLLKELIISRGANIEKTHYLDAIHSTLLAEIPDLNAITRDIVALDRYLPRLRYPHGSNIANADFISCFEYYERIKALLTGYLEPTPPRSEA